MRITTPLSRDNTSIELPDDVVKKIVLYAGFPQNGSFAAVSRKWSRCCKSLSHVARLHRLIKVIDVLDQRFTLYTLRHGYSHIANPFSNGAVLRLRSNPLEMNSILINSIVSTWIRELFVWGKDSANLSVSNSIVDYYTRQAISNIHEEFSDIEKAIYTALITPASPSVFNLEVSPAFENFENHPYLSDLKRLYPYLSLLHLDYSKLIPIERYRLLSAIRNERLVTLLDDQTQEARLGLAPSLLNIISDNFIKFEFFCYFGIRIGSGEEALEVYKNIDPKHKIEALKRLILKLEQTPSSFHIELLQRIQATHTDSEWNEAIDNVRRMKSENPSFLTENFYAVVKKLSAATAVGLVAMPILLPSKDYILMALLFETTAIIAYLIFAHLEKESKESSQRIEQKNCFHNT